MKRLLFVRHGESEHHTLGLTGGWTDSALTLEGARQVRRLAEHLDGLALPADTRLFTSDLKRALDSAIVIGSSLGLAPTVVPDLREINTGDAAGLTPEQAARVNAPEPEVPDLDWRPNPRAETYREMGVRIRAALDELDASGADTAIVVGHGLSGQELVKAWLGLPVEVRVAFGFAPASLTELGVNRWAERAIAYLNRLPAGL